MDETRFYQRPAGQIIIGTLLTGIVYLIFTVFAGGWRANRYQIIADGLICVVALVGWLLFYSQFILPVRKIGERLRIFDRLITYIVGGHGPAIFVESGIKRERDGEAKKHGPGVIWLDSASAAVLRTATTYKEAVGPGIVFTAWDEYIAATADLHTQITSIGPTEEDKPFKVEKDNPDFESISKRKMETLGLTRDGIEVAATISMLFRIDPGGADISKSFGYNKENVYKAITKSITAGAAVDRPVWNPILLKMAADVWRDYLRKFKLIELFEIPDDKTPDDPMLSSEERRKKNKTRLQLIVGMLSARLSKPEVEEWDDFGVATGRKIPSPEFSQIKEMGYKVVNVNVKRLHFSQEVEDRLIGTWTTTWLKNARKESEQVLRERKLVDIAGEQEAILDFALTHARKVDRTDPKNMVEALLAFLHTTQGKLSDSRLASNLTTEPDDIQKIITWLKNQQGGM
jgi:hypothetical protein